MINLFFSYSHADEELRNQLQKHLSILSRQGIIQTWHDRRIDAGSEVHSEISRHLESAQIILLLVSSDFLASDYCYDLEMKKALKMHETGVATVIPVILRACDWNLAPFGKLLATPLDGKPVTKFATLDDGFLQVTIAIRNIAERLTKGSNDKITQEIPVFRNPLPRSSNLRIQKSFTDRDKDQFMDEAFTYIANYFEGSLEELKKRNSEIDARFKRIDSQNFNATIYKNGDSKSECSIFIGGPFGNHTIGYSNQISPSRNSFNSSLSLTNDGELLALKPGSLSFGYNSDRENLTNEGAAEFFWELFIKPLQGR